MFLSKMGVNMTILRFSCSSKTVEGTTNISQSSSLSQFKSRFKSRLFSLAFHLTQLLFLHLHDIWGEQSSLFFSLLIALYLILCFVCSPLFSSSDPVFTLLFSTFDLWLLLSGEESTKSWEQLTSSASVNWWIWNFGCRDACTASSPWLEMILEATALHLCFTRWQKWEKWPCAIHWYEEQVRSTDKSLHNTEWF